MKFIKTIAASTFVFSVLSACADNYTKHNFIGYTVADKILNEYGAPKTADQINGLLNGIWIRINEEGIEISAEDRASMNELMNQIGLKIITNNSEKKLVSDSMRQTRQRQEELFFSRLDNVPSVFRHPAGLMFSVVNGRIPESIQPPAHSQDVFQLVIKLTIKDQFGEHVIGTNNEPVKQTIIADRMIPILQIGISMMDVGDTYIFYVPSTYAYGSRQVGNIKPYSSLEAKVTLLDRCQLKLNQLDADQTPPDCSLK